MRQLAKDHPAGTWVFQERDGGGAACTPPPINPTTAAEQPVVAGYDILGKLGRGGMGLVYQARAGRLSRPIGQRFQSLEALAKAVQIARARPMLDERFREMRREAVACLALTDLRVLSQRKVSKPWRSSVAFDATLKRAAWCDDQGDICLIQIDNEQEILHLPGPGSFPGQVFSQFSPDGRFLAAGYDFLPEHPPSQRCLVWEFLESGGVRRIPLAEKERLLAFRPDSRGVAIGQADGSIGLYDFAAGQEKHLCPGFGAENLAFHPDGKLFACSRADHPAVILVNAATGDKVGSLARRRGGCQAGAGGRNAPGTWASGTNKSTTPRWRNSRATSRSSKPGRLCPVRNH